MSSASLLASDWTKAQSFVRALAEEEALALEHHWDFWARNEQKAPPGLWTAWLYMGGRGAGKTRAGAEWIRARAESGKARRIALVAANANDGREVMVEGESGLLAIAPPWARPSFEPSKRKLTWPNGAVATLYSAEEPDSLRGPQHDTAWCDELAKWSYVQAAWDNLQLGLRLGRHPQQVITTTPRPLKIFKTLMLRNDTAVTRGTTYDNRAHLAPSFFADVLRRYEGTRFGRQEINAEILEDLPGALWTREMIENARLFGREGSNVFALPEMKRIVIGVDPSGTAGNDGRDGVGIVVAAKGADGLGYVLADLTCSLSPAGWGKCVADAAEQWKADCVIAESNFGGAMVESVLRTAGVKTKVKMGNASRGKSVRAEPIAALYEQRRVRHAGAFTELEDQLCGFTREGYLGESSPDRADALVWALSELMLGQETPGAGWLEFAARELKRMGVE